MIRNSGEDKIVTPLGKKLIPEIIVQMISPGYRKFFSIFL